MEDEGANLEASDQSCYCRHDYTQRSVVIDVTELCGLPADKRDHDTCEPRAGQQTPDPQSSF